MANGSGEWSMARYHRAMQQGRRPFISLLTDFGPDAAAAICRGVMLTIAPDAQILDVSHSVRKYAIRDGAFLLWIALPSVPVGVHVAVVDPGVGTARRPIGLRTGRGDILIGPDNGLLTPAATALGGLVEARVLENRAWMLPRTSATFHGRDVFSPIAAHLAIGGEFEEVGPQVDLASLVTITFPEPVVGDGVLESAVVYIDSFGNLRLAGDPSHVTQAFGEPASGTPFRVEFASLDGGGPHVEDVPWARTFGEIPPGRPLLYEDSFGNLAFADNQADAARRLGARIDQRVTIRRA
jgi:S-adenosylmethionine hydrolase